MASINSIQEQQITFISGVTAGGTVAAQSFWSWNSDFPATYGPVSHERKWGPATAGTEGQISYAFELASNWSDTEKSAFIASMDLWSAVANVNFFEQSDDIARLIITRNGEEEASGGTSGSSNGGIGSSVLGRTSRAEITIDASSDAFGPLGGALRTSGGNPTLTITHEIGHILGLGHAGAYNLDEVEVTAYTIYDSTPWSIMSYNDQGSSGDGASYNWGTSTNSNGLRYGNVPTTWMPLDIVAIQRLYGVAVDTPLSGGQTYGFNTNITGTIAKFFDFTQNSSPVITLWNKGAGNTLDLSGFTQASTVNMADGTFSSVAGRTNNLAIAYGTRINTVIGGPGADTIVANDNSDNILGGSGADSLSGGSGNDHLYGASTTAVAGDGADTINGGAGGDYLQGNAGEDRLDGGDGSDRIQGGQGNDSILGSAGSDTVNGNLGNDMINGGDGNDSLRGGQGADSIEGGAGNDLLMGDLGADSLTGGAGLDVLTGGGDGDLFNFSSGDASFAASGAMAGLTDIVSDFADGTDRIHLGFGVPSQILYGAAFSDFASAAASAQQLLDSQAGFTDAAVLSVGGDSYIFYDPGTASPLEALRLAAFATAAAITTVDFI